MAIGDVRRRSFTSQRRIRGTVVEYSCGSDVVSGLVVLVGSTAMSQETDKGAEIERRIRNYLILATELVIGGAQFKPRPGHVITEPGGEQFEVAPMDGQPCWRWSDPYHILIRVHAQQITG